MLAWSGFWGLFDKKMGGFGGVFAEFGGLPEKGE